MEKTNNKTIDFSGSGARRYPLGIYSAPKDGPGTNKKLVIVILAAAAVIFAAILLYSSADAPDDRAYQFPEYVPPQSEGGI